MGIEQFDNDKYYEDKKNKREKQKKIDFFESQKLKAETSNLLQSLAKEISIKFGIDINTVKGFIESTTSSSLENLQSSLGKNNTIDISDLLGDINDAKSQIEDMSKKYREELKKSIDQNPFEPEKHEYLTSRRMLGESSLKRIQNPQNITDQLLGAGIGIIDSTESVIFFLYGLARGILLTPYHIYLMLGKKHKLKL